MRKKRRLLFCFFDVEFKFFLNKASAFQQATTETKHVKMNDGSIRRQSLNRQGSSSGSDMIDLGGHRGRSAKTETKHVKMNGGSIRRQSLILKSLYNSSS